MIKLSHTIILASIFLTAYGSFGGSTAYAQSCSAKAARLASQKGGKVLSASSSGNKCKIKLLVPSPNKPPRRVTLTVPK